MSDASAEKRAILNCYVSMNKFRVSFKVSTLSLLIVMVTLTIFAPRIIVWYVGDGSDLYLTNIERIPLVIEKIKSEPETIESAEFVEMLKSTMNYQVQIHALHQTQTQLQMTLGMITVFWLIFFVIYSFLVHGRKNET